MKIRDYIKKLSFEQLKEVFSNYEELEKTGKIGDCLLRSLAEQIITDLENSDSYVIFWMERVVFDCYRLVAEKPIEQGFKYE